MAADRRVYRVGRLLVESSIALPELRPAPGGEPEWTVDVQRAPFDWTERPRMFHRWTTPGGRAWLTLSRAGADYHLRFSRTASFAIRIASRRVECRPDRGVPRATLRHLLLDQVLPLVSSTRHLVVHASAVSAPRGAVLFVGPSGHGKSTLAASLALAGWPLLTDDSVTLGFEDGRLRVWPSYPGSRLWPDSLRALRGRVRRPTRSVAHYTRKRRLTFDGAAPASGAWPLRRVYVLAAPREMKQTRRVVSTPMAPREALVEIIRHGLHLDVEDRSALERTFQVAAYAAGSVEVRRLSYPWRLDRLDEVRQAVHEDIGLDLP